MTGEPQAGGPIDLERLPLVVDGPGVEIRATRAGALTVALVRLEQGHDARPAFAGLPDGLCQCPHWGYVISGAVRVWSATGSEDYLAGQAFYWPPGHAPEALEDSSFLEISPTAEVEALYAHVTGRS
jgi:hypothetical protein